MALEIQNDFAASFARHSWNKDNWQVSPEEIAGYIAKWWDKFNEQNPKAFVPIYYKSVRPKWASQQITGMFFGIIEYRNHVLVPKELQEAATEEFIKKQTESI